MATNNKMQWFINEYNNDSLTFDIASTKRNYGTICMPTGTGKSGKIYANIIYNINQLAAQGWKKHLVVNLNSPILKLNQQLINDLIDILNGTHIIDNSEIGIYVNSSDNASEYDKFDNLSVNPDKLKNIRNFNYKLNIVASCNPSLYHFYKKLTKMDRSDLEVITYLDEAHTLNGSYEEPDSKGMNKEAKTPDLRQLCEVCDKVYAFSATPDPNVTQRINSFENGVKDDHSFIITVTPSQAIAENLIIPPRFRYTAYENGPENITSEVCINCLNDAKQLTPEIKHKVLVTCSDSLHLYNLRTALQDKGYKVFSTCAKYLYDLDPTNNYEESKRMSVFDFMKNIEDYDGDCFVLHIRQLICGIDVKGLTDCIIYDNFSGPKSSWRVYVQTIGRILRTANGERGKSIDKRTKKYGNVYFYNSDKDDQQKMKIAEMFTAIYGITTEFENVFGDPIGSGISRHAMTIDKNIDNDDNKGEHNHDGKNPVVEDIRIKLKDIVNSYKNYGSLYDILKKNNTFKDQVYKDFISSCVYVDDSDTYSTIDIINVQESLRETVYSVGKSMALW